jgi:beta-hydroxylase
MEKEEYKECKECNCNENGFQQLPPRNSWNNTCDNALLFSVVFIIGIVLLCLSFLPNGNYKWLLFPSLFLLSLCAMSLYIKPITLLHIPSSVLTYQLRTPEFLDMEREFPNHILFESKFEEIKKEVSDLLEKTNHGQNLPLMKDSFEGENTSIGQVKISESGEKAWRVLPIKTGNQYSEYAQKYFPTLSGILKQTDDVVTCMISMLEPGVTIPIHVGYYKGIVRYMLPTHVPKERDKVFLCVNGKKYHWTEGVGVLWDDTFPHKVYNYSDEIRVVIFIDVKRKLNGWMDTFNSHVIDIGTNSSIVRNEIKRTEKQMKI